MAGPGTVVLRVRNRSQRAEILFQGALDANIRPADVRGVDGQECVTREHLAAAVELEETEPCGVSGGVHGTQVSPADGERRAVLEGGHRR